MAITRELGNLFINFKAGDLLYGLETMRAGFRVSLKKTLGEKIPVTIDELNNIVIYQICDDNSYRYNPKKEAQYYTVTAAKEVKVHAGEFQKLSSTIDPAYFAEHLTAIKYVDKYPKVSVCHVVFPSNDKKLEREARMLRRTCKARLLDAKHTIHFILDGIQLRDVIDKKYSEEQSERPEIHNSFTSAELRFILKHFHEMNNIKFYLQAYECTLMQWIQQQSADTKKALTTWCQFKFSQHKLDKITLEQIHKAVQPVDPSFAPRVPQFISEAVREIPARLVPPTPKKKRKKPIVTGGFQLPSSAKKLENQMGNVDDSFEGFEHLIQNAKSKSDGSPLKKTRLSFV